jgi:DNA-binding CsgD family transcriptional regulator
MGEPARFGAPLTAQERAIALAMSGTDEPTVERVALDLGLSVHGAKDSVKRIHQKTGARTKIGVQRYLLRCGLLVVPVEPELAARESVPVAEGNPPQAGA